jgi:hypothetical protein
MPKLAEIIECRTESIATIFSWIGVQDKSLVQVKQIADDSMGEIVEYGEDRYKIEVTGKLEGVVFTKTITVDGPTLMNQLKFYDAVVMQAQVWIPKMKAAQFEEIMRMKFESRTKSKNYVAEAAESNKIKKYFVNYIKVKKAYTTKAELFNYGNPYFNPINNELEFSLNDFEDYLEEQRVVFKKRVDLVLLVQDVLKAYKKNGSYQKKSLVSWVIENPEIESADFVLEGTSEETKEVNSEQA